MPVCNKDNQGLSIINLFFNQETSCTQNTFPASSLEPIERTASMKNFGINDMIYHPSAKKH
jgi:hypothetical protein